MVSVADWRVSVYFADSARLACKAFDVVFQRRQTQHRVLLAWIGRSLAAVRPTSNAESCILEGAIAWRAGRAAEVSER